MYSIVACDRVPLQAIWPSATIDIDDRLQFQTWFAMIEMTLRDGAYTTRMSGLVSSRSTLPSCSGCIQSEVQSRVARHVTRAAPFKHNMI